MRKELPWATSTMHQASMVKQRRGLKTDQADRSNWFCAHTPKKNMTNDKKIEKGYYQYFFMMIDPTIKSGKNWSWVECYYPTYKEHQKKDKFSVTKKKR